MDDLRLRDRGVVCLGKLAFGSKRNGRIGNVGGNRKIGTLREACRDIGSDNLVYRGGLGGTSRLIDCRETIGSDGLTRKALVMLRLLVADSDYTDKQQKNADVASNLRPGDVRLGV